MAAGDKLWFELGVRDEISQVLEKLMTNSQKLANLLTDDASELKNIYKNISDVAGVYDKIYVAQKRIRDLRTTTLGADEKKGLRDMSKELEKVRKDFEGVLSDPGRLMAKGEASFDKLRTNIDLMVKDTLRYVDGIEAKEKAEAINAANEERRIDSLKAKYYDLQRQRQELANAIANAAPGANTANAVSLLNGISARMGAVTSAQRRGTGMPASLVGSDADEFYRKVKAEIASLNTTTNDYNRTLDTNARIYNQLKKAYLDTQSQQQIAAIRNQRAEYTALGQKLLEVGRLMSSVATDRTTIQGGGSATYTAEKVMEELDAINRRYNETLALGREQERKSTRSRQQLSDASKNSADATRNMTQANKGLLSTFKELDKAGKSTNRMIDQMATSFGTMFSFYGMKRLVQQVVTIGGQFEFQHVALQNILGDIQEANTLFSQLQDLAVESPKTFMELTSYAKQLSAYQIPANELYDTTKRLADMSTGLGVDMGRLILAYGQVRSAAVLRGQELRQFTEAGIPLVQKLADKFTEMNGKLTTTADVFKLISARKVPFEMVQEVLWDMTNQGGQFYNMQSELADTLYGKWQKLQDTWQIMLGHLADGKSVLGGFMRTALEGIVALTRSMDVLMPMLAMFGAGRVFRGTKSLITTNYERVQSRTDEGAIVQMRLAKEKEANRLMRERYQMGRMLTAQEWELVRTKSQVTLNDKLQLAYEGRLSDLAVAKAMSKAREAYLQEQLDLMAKGYTAEEARQLAIDKERNILLSYRLLLMKGYTKEQIRQMQNGNFQMAQGSVSIMSRIGKGVFNFFGGLPGIILTALGGVMSIFSYIDQEAEKLEQKGDAMMSHAQQNANELKKAINLTDSEGSMDKKIEAVEDALINLGAAGEAIVAKSREHMDDINKRWETLRAGAEDYQKTLESLGNTKGKALFQEAIDDSDVEDRLKEYDAAVNDVYRHYGKLNRFSEVYKEYIDMFAKGNETLAKQLEGKNMFEQIDIIGADKLVKKIEEKIKTLRKNTTERIYLLQANASLQMHLELLDDVNDRWETISEKSVPAMKDELEAMAKNIGIESFDALTPEQKQSLETLTREYVNSISEGSKEAKDKLAQELASQVFKITIEADLSIDKTKLSSFANYVWKKFGGIVAGDEGKVNIGQESFTKQQVKNIFDNVGQFAKEYNAEWKSQTEEAAKLRKSGAEELAKDVEKEAGKTKSVLDALNLFDDGKNGKGKGSASKKDTELERWKNNISMLEKYRKELEELEKLMTRSEAEKRLRKEGEFNALWGYFTNPNDYAGSIDEAIRELQRESSPDRQKLIDDLNSKQSAENLRRFKDNTKDAVDELQRMLSVMSENYQTYKKWMELTGDSGIAASMAGVAQNTTYSKYLRDEMEKALRQAGWRETAESVLGLSLSGAKQFGEESAIFKIWDDYRKEQERVRKEDMDELYNATKKLMTVDEEILAIERQIQELRRKGATANDERVLAKQKELQDKQVQQFENSEPYLRFYSAIMSMTADEAEAAGAAIKKNLVDQLAQGQITADKYLKSIKNVDTQLQTIRGKKSDFSLFATGGIKAIQSQRQKQAEDNLASTAIEIQKLADEILAARKAISKAENEGNAIQLETAKNYLNTLLEEQKLLENRHEKQKKILESIVGEVNKLNDALAILEMISGAFDGLEKAAQQISDMFQALGQSETAAGWSDAAGYIGAIGSPIKSATNAIKSAMSGDVGGVISNTVGIITSPITALAKLHDAKLDRAIQKSQREVKKLGNEYKNIQAAMEKALGGIYASGGYSEMLENLKKQYKELEGQMDDEYEKKDTDADKIEDYKQQLIELKQQIEDFALDMANTLYSIDLHSWASQFTEVIVGAWEKGEDAVEAYKNKVKEIIKDLTTNILTKKVMEAAFENLGIDEIIKNEMITKEGKLDENSLVRVAEALNKAGEITVSTITGILDQLEKGGYIERGSESSSSSASSTISKSVTEDTAGLLLSYVNGIRADVSVERFTLDQILITLQGLVGENSIAQSQLEQLKNIAAYTLRTAQAAEAIQTLFHSVAPDGQSVRMK